MTKVTSINFTGKSGKSYTFDTYDKKTSFNNVSAVYIFTKRYQRKDGAYTQDALYIGESAELGTRIMNHEKWPCVDKNGCTHISILRISGDKARIDAETDLRNAHKTPCNDQ